MKKRNKVLTAALAVTLLVGSASLAYFTDRAERTLTGEAGNICLKEVNIEHDLENMAPGDARDIKYSYKNTGSLSIDTRITYIMNYKESDEFSEELEDIATLTDGENVLTLKGQDSRMTVDGPTIKGTREGAGLDIMDKTIQFKLLEEVSNGAQDMEFTIDIIVEGKQNKNDAEWSELNTKTITIHGNEVEVVEESACNVIVIDNSRYFKFTELSDGTYSVDGYVDNIEEVLEEDGVDPNVRFDLIIPSVQLGKPVTSIGTSAFRNNNLTSVEIPNSVISIGGSAFRENNLTSVNIPDSVTQIGNWVFAQNQLTSVDLGNSMTMTGNYAFYHNNLTSVVIPGSITKIGNSAFRENELISVVIPNSVTTIEAQAFRSNKLESVEIPSSIDKISDYTFYHNNLTSVVIPDSVTLIGYAAFERNQLTSVDIPNSVVTIGGSAFQHNQITSVIIPDSVTTIEISAFESNNLTSVRIPDSVATIEERAFDFNTGGTVHANLIDSDLWPTLRGYKFSRLWSLKSLDEL